MKDPWVTSEFRVADMLAQRSGLPPYANDAVGLLGFLFVYLQATEYIHAYHLNLKLSSGIYGSTFFMLTGFHGFHVTMGAIIVTLFLGGPAGPILFGPEITFRAQPHGTFKFLFNGIHSSRAEQVAQVD